LNTVTPAIKDLARRLIALEAARDAAAGGAARACDQLRRPLTRMAGAAGFRSLLSRALALAKAGDYSLNSVHIREDGVLDGLAGDDGAAVVAHLLGLLETFIGASLTRQLVRDAWPDAASDKTDDRDGKQS